MYGINVDAIIDEVLVIQCTKLHETVVWEYKQERPEEGGSCLEFVMIYYELSFVHAVVG